MKKFSQFNIKTRNKNGEYIIANSLTGAVCKLSEDEYENVKLKLKDEDVFEANIKKLISMGILVDSELNEIQRCQFMLNSALYKKDDLHLIIMPTENCNCRCTYCYESFEKGKMSDETVNRVKLFIKNQAQYLKKLSINWFGGEPLIGLEIIEDITNSIFEQRELHKFVYSSNITTNGVLLDQNYFDRLLKLEIKDIQFTFDGYEEEHDKRKKLIGGGKTFETIFTNLKNIVKSTEDFYVTIRINCDKGNIESIKKLLGELRSLFYGDKRFGIFFRGTNNFGGKNELNNFDLLGANNIPQEFEDYLSAENIQFNLRMPKLASQICYAALPNGYVVGSDAELYKCTVHFNETKNKVGIISKEGELKLYVDRVSEWVCAENMNEECLKCFLYPSCNGKACPVHTVLSNKTQCTQFRTNFNDALNRYHF